MKKYELVVQDIVSKICQNSISHKLPAERELSEIYGLSRFTIRKALAKLEAIGMVKSKGVWLLRQHFSHWYTTGVQLHY